MVSHPPCAPPDLGVAMRSTISLAGDFGAPALFLTGDFDADAGSAGGFCAGSTRAFLPLAGIWHLNSSQTDSSVIWRPDHVGTPSGVTDMAADYTS